MGGKERRLQSGVCKHVKGPAHHTHTDTCVSFCEPRTAVVRFNQELDLASRGWGSEGGRKWGGLVGGEC